MIVPSHPRSSPEPMKTVPTVVPLIASGCTVLIIVALVAVASGGTTFVLEIALAVMVAGFATCFWMISHLRTSRDVVEGWSDNAEELEPSVHDLPRGNPTRPDIEYAEHTHLEHSRH
jgi:MFS superfamily sulfate permease-like transporter